MVMVGEMVAGREMDALIAEKVMGWQCAPEGDLYHYWGDGPGWHDGHHWDRLPSFSTDMGAAWQVMEHFTFWSLIHEQPGENNGGLYTCYLKSEWSMPGARDLHTYLGEAGVAETAPLAICRAALEAVTALPTTATTPQTDR